MGSATSSFSMLTEDILDEYSMLTYLSKAEILRLYKIFSNFGSENLQTNHRYSVNQVELAFPQLKYNPFRERIYKVFSSEKDGKLSFEDILDLCSVMSQKCPDKVKAAWAFRIFDYDEDGAVGERDLMTVMDRLTDWQNSGNRIDKPDQKHIVQVLLKEMDLESNGTIGQLEFEHAVGKMSEFPHSFRFAF
ncbi:calcium and integrin-binding protein 1 [Tribolium castaneum]|uniref:Frequenin-1-like Protein n=1 Tax=Tribolium castaneum TaxID=7070 RepID=D6WTX7_TRICA|nr:PREDICTED: calcium and integrin-binding protein 1 [Tribolium castaneum]EFA07348.1 Frequenin-1-like Protein [Tribolium castaneum]|eukprot:XP_008200154.1 PREDICTED: calcium and integrin-binding protein 1 [Tribolium castaneum]